MNDLLGWDLLITRERECMFIYLFVNALKGCCYLMLFFTARSLDSLQQKAEGKSYSLFPIKASVGLVNTVFS